MDQVHKLRGKRFEIIPSTTNKLFECVNCFPSCGNVRVWSGAVQDVINTAACSSCYIFHQADLIYFLGLYNDNQITVDTPDKSQIARRNEEIKLHNSVFGRRWII